jgi:putative FmdB family regulatory protein
MYCFINPDLDEKSGLDFIKTRRCIAMPIYEFECKKCGKRFERLMLSLDDKNPECPVCNNEEVRKIMSAGSKVTLKIPGGYGGGLTPPSCTPGG